MPLDARRKTEGGRGEVGFKGDVAGWEGRRAVGVFELGVGGAEDKGVLVLLEVDPLCMAFERSSAR